MTPYDQHYSYIDLKLHCQRPIIAGYVSSAWLEGILFQMAGLLVSVLNFALGMGVCFQKISWLDPLLNFGWRV